jgi:hypothetical protein
MVYGYTSIIVPKMTLGDKFSQKLCAAKRSAASATHAEAFLATGWSGINRFGDDALNSDT